MVEAIYKGDVHAEIEAVIRVGSIKVIVILEKTNNYSIYKFWSVWEVGTDWQTRCTGGQICSRAVRQINSTSSCVITI